MNTPARVLFSVAVDPNALLEFKDPEHKQTHVAAEKILRQYAILSFGPGDKQALLRAIGDLSGRPHQVWKGVVEYLRNCRREDDQARTIPLTEFLQSDSNRDNSADLVRLAVVGNRPQTLADRSRIGANMTEQKMLPDIDESMAVIEAGRVGTYPPSTSRSAISEQLLKPLAARSNQVKIMDPHILELLITADDRKRRPLHGVEWLLNVLAQAMPPTSTIWLIGALANDWSPSSRAGGEARLDELLKRALRDREAPLTVEVRLVQSAASPLKNRHLWFDCGASFDVLHNFHPLEVDPLREELRFVRQDEVTAKQTYQLAERYETSKLERGRIFVTKAWGMLHDQAAIDTTPYSGFSPKPAPTPRGYPRPFRPTSHTRAPRP